MTMGSDRARAGDAHLDASTILLLSFDDWGAMSSEAKASDFGRFMKDPEIKAIMTRLQPAFMEMMKSMMAEELESGPASSLPGGGEKMAEIGERLMGAAMSIGGRMCENMTGRTAISISLLLDPTAPLPMNLIFEFGGGEEIQKAVDEMFSLLEKESEGEMKARTIEIEGQKGRCIESDGAGIFVVRSGERFTAGVHEASLRAHLKSMEAGAVRLGNVPFYKKAMGAVGEGRMKFFMNLEPVWSMAMPMLSGLAADMGEPSPMAVISALGLQQFQGVAASGSMSAAGSRERAFFGISGRSGLMRLIPTENRPLAPAAFAPADAISATSIRLELAQVIPALRDVVRTLAGEEEMQGMEEMLAGTQMMLGFTVEELLGDLEGTIFTFSPSGPAPDLMSMMMMGGSIDTCFGIRMSSRERLDGLLGMFSDPQISQGMVSKQEIAGRSAYVVNAAPAMGMPLQICTTIEGDWWLIATSAKALRESLERADSGKGLRGNAAIAQLMGEVGGTSGMMVGFANAGQQLANALDAVRPLLGMAPMMMPELADPSMMFLFDPTILPSSATVKKYFGVQATRVSIVDGGILQERWTPPVGGAAPAEKDGGKKEGAKPSTGVGL